MAKDEDAPKDFTKELEAARAKLQAAQEEVDRIQRKVRATEIFNKILSGELDPDRLTGSAPRKARASTGIRAPRSGGKREAVLAALKAAPEGLTRGELLEKLGVKGDKKQEASASQALTALNKTNSVHSVDGRWRAA